MNTVTIEGLNITANEIAQILQQHYTTRNVRVVDAHLVRDEQREQKQEEEQMDIMCTDLPMRVKDVLDLDEALEFKSEKLLEAEMATKKALESANGFQKQHQATYSGYLTLRNQMEEQKATLLKTLWVHCGAYHPELREIPVLETSSKFLETEDRVGEYLIGDILGQGQFATVKSCRRKGADKDELAIKIIKKERFITFTALRRISVEIEVLRRLKSQYIVSIKDVVQTKNFLYMITEKGGKDLFESFDDTPNGIPELWARDIITGVFKATLYCHELGICHRDLKPENILLTFDKELGKCIDLKLCDFGLAAKINSNSMLSDFCGSPGFFAPEMIVTGKYHGDNADLWSVGCILLEMLFGHRKFIDIWMLAYDYEVLQDKALFTEEIQLACASLSKHLTFSSSLNEFLMTLLVLEPTQRPSAKKITSHPWFENMFRTGSNTPCGEDPRGRRLSSSGNRSPSGTENREIYMPMLSEALKNLSRGSPSGLENKEVSMPLLSEALKALSVGIGGGNENKNTSHNSHTPSPVGTSQPGDLRSLRSGSTTPSYPPSRLPPPPGHGNGIDNPLPPVKGPFIQCKSQPRSPNELVKSQGPTDNLANRTLGNLNTLEKAYLEEYLELKVAGSLEVGDLTSLAVSPTAVGQWMRDVNASGSGSGRARSSSLSTNTGLEEALAESIATTDKLKKGGGNRVAVTLPPIADATTNSHFNGGSQHSSGSSQSIAMAISVLESLEKEQTRSPSQNTNFSIASSSSGQGISTGSRQPPQRGIDHYYSGHHSNVESPRDLHVSSMSPREKSLDSFSKLSPRDFNFGGSNQQGGQAKSSSYRDIHREQSNSSRLFVVPQAPFGSFVSESSEHDFHYTSSHSNNNNNLNHNQLHASFASMTSTGIRSDRPGGGMIPHSSSSDSNSVSYHRDIGTMDDLPIGRANSIETEEEEEYISHTAQHEQNDEINDLRAFLISSGAVADATPQFMTGKK